MKAPGCWTNTSVNVVANTDNGCHPTGATPSSEKKLKRHGNLNLNLVKNTSLIAASLVNESDYLW